MYHLRRTKTSSGATAVQVVEYLNRKLIVASHIGSARTKDELWSLDFFQKRWICARLGVCITKYQNSMTVNLGGKQG
jgi:hypothetical protein